VFVSLKINSFIERIAAKMQQPRSTNAKQNRSKKAKSVYADLHKLILRQCAILGSTGSGKSNTTVSILKAILNGYQGSRVRIKLNVPRPII